MGAAAGGLYSYRQLTVKDESAVGSNIKQQRDEEIPASGFVCGVSGVLVKNKWQLQTEMLYTTSGYKRKFINLLFGDQIDDQYGFVQNPSAPAITSYELQSAFTNIRIPILLGYAFNLSENKRHQLIPQLGVSNNLLLKVQQEITIQYDDGSTVTNSRDRRQSPYKTYSVSAVCGVTYMYTIKRVSFSGALVFNQSLTPVGSGSVLSEYEYWGAAKVGAFYTLY